MFCSKIGHEEGEERTGRNMRIWRNEEECKIYLYALGREGDLREARDTSRGAEDAALFSKGPWPVLPNLRPVERRIKLLPTASNSSL